MWIALVVAMAASAALDLWLGRDTGFSIDEVRVFDTSANLDVATALQPFNGHLVLIPRLVFAAILNVFGTGYLPFRIFTIATVLVLAGTFFVFAKRRIGSVAAFAPTLVLLFYGSDAPHVLLGNGFGVLLPLAAGLGALLLLDRRNSSGDLGACLLLCLALATYSVALPFVAGAAVLILIGIDRWRRAWVVLIPVALYAAWLIWSRSHAGSTGGNLHLDNLLLAPNWSLNSLSSVGAALLGLNYPSFGSGWGPVVAVAAATGLVWRLSRGRIPRWLWATMAVLSTLWLMGAVAALPPIRVPQKSEYMFPATIAVLLVAVEASRGVRLQRRGMTILYAATVISLGTNIALLRDGSRQFRATNVVTRSTLTATEISKGRISQPGFGDEADYLRAVLKFGSPAFTPAGLRTQSEATRDRVDGLLARGYGLQLQPAPAPGARCRSITGRPGQAVSLVLRPPGVTLKSRGATAPLLMRRFGTTFTVNAGQVQAGGWMTLRVPRDSVADPWYGLTTATPLSVCNLPG